MRKGVLAAAGLALLAAVSFDPVPAQAVPLAAPASLKGAAQDLTIFDHVSCWDDCYDGRPYYRPYRYGYGRPWYRRPYGYGRPYYRPYYSGYDRPYYRPWYRPYSGYYRPYYRPWYRAYYGYHRPWYRPYHAGYGYGYRYRPWWLSRPYWY